MNYKNYLINRKDYTCGGVTFNRDDETIISEKDGVIVKIPQNKFSNIIKNGVGSITYQKQQFKIPKPKVSDTDIIIHLKNNGKETKSNPIRSFDCTSDEHVYLIEYLMNSKNIISIGTDSKGGIRLEISTDNQVEQDLSVNYHTESIKEIKEIVDYVLDNTNLIFFIYDNNELKEKFDISIPGDRDYEFKNFYKYDYFLKAIGEMNMGASLFDRAIQNATFFINWGKHLIVNPVSGEGKIYEELKSILDKIDEIKEREQVEENSDLKKFTSKGIDYIEVDEFKKGNVEKIIEVVKMIDPKSHSTTRNQLEWILINSVRKSLFDVVQAIGDLFENHNAHFNLDLQGTLLLQTIDRIETLDEDGKKIFEFLVGEFESICLHSTAKLEFISVIKEKLELDIDTEIKETLKSILKEIL